jgi:hypothetical protein
VRLDGKGSWNPEAGLKVTESGEHAAQVPPVWSIERPAAALWLMLWCAVLGAAEEAAAFRTSPYAAQQESPALFRARASR